MSESGGTFFVHNSLINIPWAAHKDAYMPAQFSGLATIGWMPLTIPGVYKYVNENNFQ